MEKYCRFVFGVILYLACNFKINCKQIDLERNKCSLYSRSGQMTKDLNALSRPEGYVVTSNTVEKYIINICGEFACGEKNVHGCKIDENGIASPFGVTWKISKTHMFYYNDKVEPFFVVIQKDNPHILLGCYERNSFWFGMRKGKKVAQILLGCDYSLQEPKVYVTSPGGKKGLIKLNFTSSFLCFSEPTICKINVERSIIDISSLNRDRNWKVKNDINEDQIYLNLCGPINPISKYPGCSENGTQICLLTKTEGDSLNLGSSSSELKPNKDNGWALSFSGGYICEANRDTVTEIEFTCGFVEEGPILVSKADCKYLIHWRTPAICPHYISESKNCLINDNFNEQNYIITSIYQEETLSNNNVIKYNVCDDLKTSCNKEKIGVSFCLLKNEKEIVLGRSNKSVLSRDGQVTMHMTGENCSLSKIYNVFVTFYCDYTKNKPTLFSFSDDLCTVNVTIFTNEVCWDPYTEKDNCVTDSNERGKYYNLTGLQLNDRNYEVEDPKNNVTYILNMCQPIVVNPMAFCSGAICARYNNEPDINKRFLELGTSDFKIKEFKNTLTVEMTGAICKEIGGSSDHHALIQFHCAEKNLITLNSSDKCKHIFIWESKYACLLEKPDTNTFQETPEETNKKRNDKIVEKAEDVSKNNLILKDINESEVKDTKIKPIKQSIITSKSVEIVTQKYISEPVTESNIISLSVPIQVSNTTGLYINNCTLANHDSPGFNYSLFLLPHNVNVNSSNGRKYSVNLCSSQGSVTNLSLDYENRLVEIHMQGLSQCSSTSFYNSVIYLKCSSEMYYPPSVIKESICSVQLEWKNEAACALLKPKYSDDISLDTTRSNAFYEDNLVTKSSGVPVAVPIILALALLCIIAAIFFYVWRKNRFQNANPRLLTRQRDYTAMKDVSKLA